MLLQWAQGTVQQPADPAKRSEVKMTDDQILKAVANRDQKVKTFEPLQPKHTYATLAEAQTAFQSERSKTISYMETTDADMRNHFTPHPVFGTIDAYQIILLLSSHTERHTLQMEEVMASANFPKK
jgi:hypothetical protein